MISLEVGSCEAAHPLEMSLRKIVDDEDAVRIALVVGSDDVRVIGREVLLADALHVAEHVSKEKEAVLGHYVPETAVRGILLVEILVMLRAGSLLRLFGLRFSPGGLLYVLGIVSFRHANTPLSY